MKNSFILSSLASATILLSTSIALADSDSIYIEQCGNGNMAVGNQHDDPQTISIGQFGNHNSAIATQGLDINQTHGAYDTSSNADEANITQHGTNNAVDSLQIGVGNIANVSQVGNGNSASVNQNDNFSTTTIFQNGNNNTAKGAQGLVANYALAH